MGDAADDAVAEAARIAQKKADDAAAERAEKERQRQGG